MISTLTSKASLLSAGTLSKEPQMSFLHDMFSKKRVEEPTAHERELENVIDVMKRESLFREKQFELQIEGLSSQLDLLQQEVRLLKMSRRTADEEKLDLLAFFQQNPHLGAVELQDRMLRGEHLNARKR